MSENNQDDSTLEKTVVSTENTLKKQFPTEQAPPVLLVLLGPPVVQSKMWPLIQDGTVIGRSPECRVSIDDRSLSRSHAIVNIKGDEITISDMGSTNKTFVNGQQLPPGSPCILRNNDQVKTGNVIFKFLEKGSMETLNNQSLYERANRDALTGAYSKSSLIAIGPEAFKRSKQQVEPLSLVVFDIDHFKKVNDVYLHPGGDFVLKELGRVVTTKLIRSSDFFARYGGEEFVLLLPGTPIQTAQEIAERIRATIESHVFNYDSKNIPITISIGVTELNTIDQGWEDLFKRADSALYVSKQGGRNRVTVK